MSIAFAAAFCVAAAASSAGLAGAQALTAPASIPSQASGSAHSSSTEGSAANLAGIRRLIESGHAADALVQLDQLAAQVPVPVGVETLRGLAFYNQEHLTQADAAFAAALQADPHNEEAAQMRGLTLFRMGKPADAIPLLEGDANAGSAANRAAGAGTVSPPPGPQAQLGTLNPKPELAGSAYFAASSEPAQDKADPNYVLALCYIDTRRYDDARHAFAAQYGFAPDSAPAYLLAARMLLRREYLPVAQGFTEKALQLDPHLPLAHALLGEIALGGNHLEEAIAQFSDEQQRNPLEPSVYDRLGDAYSRAGKYPEAIAALQRAVLLEPHATGPYILLGKVMLKRQDAVGAATYLERAKSMDPANYMTRSLLGQAYRAMGRRDEATQETQAAQQLQAATEPKIAAPQ